tara:strand:+ start:1395 stop:2120 length:726 start_codon:yes stop_codon:yes gene_type:complete
MNRNIFNIPAWLWVIAILLPFAMYLVIYQANQDPLAQLRVPTPIPTSTPIHNIEATVQARVTQELSSMTPENLDAPDTGANVEAEIQGSVAVQSITTPNTPVPTNTPPTPTDIPLPTNTPIPFQPDVVDTVNNIVDLYTYNEVAADLAYTDKWADITGQIYLVEAKNNKVEVNLEAIGEIFTLTYVVCKMSEDEIYKAAQLRKGQVITIRGKILGVPGFSNIVVEPCIILVSNSGHGSNTM